MVRDSDLDLDKGDSSVSAMMASPGDGASTKVVGGIHPGAFPPVFQPQDTGLEEMVSGPPLHKNLTVRRERSSCKGPRSEELVVVVVEFRKPAFILSLDAGCRRMGL